MHRRQFIKGTLIGSVALVAGQVSGVAPILGRAAAQNGDQQRVVIVDRLNLRSGPGLGNQVVAVLSYGDIVSIAGGTHWADGYEWVQVAVWDSPTGGWVASEFIGAGGGSPFPPDTYVHVNVDRLNLRAGAGLGDGVVATYAGGTNAWVTGNGVSADGYLWIPVEVVDGNSGWFASEYLATGFGDIPQDRVQVADGPLNIRGEPSLGGTILGTAPAGAYGTVLDPRFVDADGYSWVHVEMDDTGTTGWMASRFLSYIDVA